MIWKWTAVVQPPLTRRGADGRNPLARGNRSAGRHPVERLARQVTVERVTRLRGVGFVPQHDERTSRAAPHSRPPNGPCPRARHARACRPAQRGRRPGGSSGARPDRRRRRRGRSSIAAGARHSGRDPDLRPRRRSPESRGPKRPARRLGRVQQYEGAPHAQVEDHGLRQVGIHQGGWSLTGQPRHGTG